VIKNINHIAIAARNIQPLSEMFSDLFGLTEESSHQDAEQGIKTVRLESNNVSVELIEPLGAESRIAGFVEKQQQGLHHVSFEVEDIDALLKKMARKGIGIINETPMELGTYRVAFLHPRSTGGILIELLEKVQ
jgi:methylmalonyl-CoA/ethylmalonyl-CoA epimerase